MGMLYRLFADCTALFHISFVLFVLFGSALVARYPVLLWWHLPAVTWGVAIELIGWNCPLTYVENHFRQLALENGQGWSFVDLYLLPIIYPALWFPGGFPSWGFPVIGIVVFVINFFAYHRIRRGRKASEKAPSA
ncbi:DUF2784 domain-containing protein [Candidatus Magnetaquicoccus inordinatus]|uniref:DUF2784 domain-containing protein n=1 Tax=Candidatus Magnetaquicoccus inordinatus TaxID=2496818 RepID=UPI001D0F1DFC|nr:DUF2784 domain-containing protein [Candidatus Magnetaquicoccus inordinatus]